VFGPLFRDNFAADAREIEPRVSAHPFWRSIGLAWLVSPPRTSFGKIWYEIHIMASCHNAKCAERGTVRVPEREGIRRFSRLSRAQIWLKAKLHLGIEHIFPQI
jgi:hypothetical protein